MVAIESKNPKVFFGEEEIIGTGDYAIPFESKGSFSFSGIFDPPSKGLDKLFSKILPWPQKCEIISEGRFCKRIFSFLADFTDLDNLTLTADVLGIVSERFEYTKLSKGIFLAAWVAYWALFVWLIAFWKV